MQRAVLVLADGTVVDGEGFGADSTVVGELVFNTAMTGYQESLTDPSYHRQILMQTYPLVGNYGIDSKRFEGSRVWAGGMVVSSLCDRPSHYSSEMTLDAFLKKNNVPGISGVDTRALAIRLREAGSMAGALCAYSGKRPDTAELLKKARGFDYKSSDLVIDYIKEEYAGKKKTVHGRGNKWRVALIDCGAKMSIARELVKRDMEVTMVPANASPADVKALSPHAIMVSNGPGNPDKTTYAIDLIRGFIRELPIGGICFGHQLIAAALGGHNYKLKYGHRGANQPVKDLRTGKVFMTAQNHGFNVHPGLIKGTGLVVSETNCNDGTVEAMEHESLPIFSTQYHPEANPGPYDATAAKFDRFKKMVEAFHEA